jgi:hypothetical protein
MPRKSSAAASEDSWTVKVRILSGRTVKFQVTPQDTVHSLKKQVHHDEDIEVSHQRFSVNRKVLKDSESLGDVASDGCTIQLSEPDGYEEVERGKAYTTRSGRTSKPTKVLVVAQQKISDDFEEDDYDSGDEESDVGSDIEYEDGELDSEESEESEDDDFVVEDESEEESEEISEGVDDDNEEEVYGSDDELTETDEEEGYTDDDGSEDDDQVPSPAASPLPPPTKRKTKLTASPTPRLKEPKSAASSRAPSKEPKSAASSRAPSKEPKSSRAPSKEPKSAASSRAPSKEPKSSRAPSKEPKSTTASRKKSLSLDDMGVDDSVAPVPSTTKKRPAPKSSAKSASTRAPKKAKA